MKHVFHLVRADLRRFRLLLAIWVLVQIVDTVVTGVRPSIDADPRLMSMIDALGAVLFLTRWLGLFLIVPLVVQAHPLVGSDAFWMTRPIPWRALLASKIVLLATTLVAVPALSEVVLMLVYRVPMVEFVLVALQTILFQTLWLLVVMALSATTRTLARFALVVGAVMVGFVLLVSTSFAVMLRSMPDGPELSVVTGRAASGPAGSVVMLLLLIMAAVVPLVVQYCTRSARTSVAAGIVSISVAVLIPMIWPWHEEPFPVPEWARQESAVQMVAESQKGEFRRLESPWNRPESWQVGRVRLGLRATEPGWLATVELAEASVGFDDGTTLATAGNGYSSPIRFESMADSSVKVVMRHVLGVGRVWERSQNQVGPDVDAIAVSEADFRKYSGKSGTYRGRFLVSLDHVEIAATLPLRAGSEFRDRHRRIVLDRIIPHTQAVSLRVRRFTATNMFSSKALPQLSFYLRNRDAAEAVAGSANEVNFMSGGAGLAMLFGVSSYSAESTVGFDVTSDLIRFPEGYGTDVHELDIRPEWLSRAELVIVRTTPAGSIVRTVEIPRFEIAAAPAKVAR
jgi:hypothetical protein